MTIPIGELKANCGDCGSEKMKYDPEGGPDAVITCANCGAYLGTNAGFSQLAELEAKRELEKIANIVRRNLKLKL